MYIAGINFDVISSIKSVGTLAGAFLGAWAFLKLLAGSKKYVRSFYFWILAKMLKTYVEKVTQEKINERLANIAEQLTTDEVKKLKEIRDKERGNTNDIWHSLVDPIFITLKSLGLVNETLDYFNSNIRLKTALQHPEFHLNYIINRKGTSVDSEFNMLYLLDDKNVPFILYKTNDGVNQIEFDTFCKKINCDSSLFNDSPESLNRLESHINAQDMKKILPLCVESTILNIILLVAVSLTNDGNQLLDNILLIEQNIESENNKRLNIHNKAVKILIEKFSKR